MVELKNLISELLNRDMKFRNKVKSLKQKIEMLQNNNKYQNDKEKE